MDIAEATVQRFLTANGDAGQGIAFVLPQFTLRDHERLGWNASLDFVVLNCDPGIGFQIIMVEVSDSGGLGSVENKASAFKNERYGELLLNQLARETGLNLLSSPCHFLGFVRTRELADSAKIKYGGGNIHFRPLSDAHDNNWWAVRMKGILPH